MTMATLEKAILAELKVVAKNSRLTKNNIMEWSTSEVKAEEGETLYFLPELKIHCAVKIVEKKKAKEGGIPPKSKDLGILPTIL